MKRLPIIGLCWMVVSLVLLSGVMFAAPNPDQIAVPANSSAVGSALASEPTGPALVAKLKATAVDQALQGQFAAAQKTIDQASKLAPADGDVAAIREILKGYQADRQKFETQRKREYDENVAGVKRSLLTQKYQPTLAAAGLDKKLSQKMQEIVGAYKPTASEQLELAGEKAAVDLKAQVLKNCATIAAAVSDCETLLKSDKSEYAQMFRGIGARVRGCVATYKAIWEASNVQDAKVRRSAARKMRDAEDELGQSLADVEGMVSEEPWRSALAYARLARELAVDKEAILQQDWWKTLVADTLTRGKAAVEKAKWYDALNAYVRLQDIDPDNADYKAMVKTVQRHVKILGLYGKAPAPTTATTGPAQTQPDDARINWKELVAGVDADMVKKAISQLDEFYVTAVDYSKMVRGSLGAVRVLVETPQAADSFPSLKDDAQRKAFLASLEEQAQAAEKRDRVDHLDLQLALNGILRANERTIQLPTEVLCVEFTEGMLDELDPFSNMVWPYDVADFNKQTMGRFFGVGVQIAKEPGEPLKVVSPLPDSPAYKAGMKVGDQILAVDGRATIDLPVDKLVRMITGEKGTKVTLRVQRAGVPQPFDVELVRDDIRIRTVKGWEGHPDGTYDFTLDAKAGIGYVRLTQFTEQSHPDIVKAIEEMKAKGVRSLVLDLRFDPGGLLKSATNIADEFLKSGRIVSTRGRQTRAAEIDATPEGVFQDGDLVVLVNQYSASAAEILSGALKDWRRAIVVGERSYGKGSVQNIIPIRKHSALLKLTTAYYYLPTGRLLHRENGSKVWGVDPDVAVPLTPNQRRQWLEIHRNTDLMLEADPAELREELDEQYKTDPQLQAAVVALKLMRYREARGPTILASEK